MYEEEVEVRQLTGNHHAPYAAVAVGQLHECLTKTQRCYKMARAVMAASIMIGKCGSV